MTGALVTLGAVGLLVLGGWYAIRGVTHDKEGPKDLCIDDLPEKDRAKAKAALAGSNTKQLETYALQADAMGAHCSAKAFRKRITEIKAVDALPRLNVVIESPVGAACAAAVAHLPNTLRDKVASPGSGGKLPSLRSLAHDAISEADPEKLRKVADLLSSPEFADAYKFTANCLRQYADVVLTTGGTVEAAATAAPMFPMEAT